MNYIKIDLFEKLFPSLNFCSHAKSRTEQNEAMMDEIISRALASMQPNSNLIENDNFFVGSADVIISKEKVPYILEINGGSVRGLWSLTESQLEKFYEGYLESLNFIESVSPLIVIGHLDRDVLLYEKLMLINRLVTLSQIPYENIILLPYSKLLPNLTFDQNRIYYKKSPINLVIGDGVTRRIKNFHPTKQLKTLILNKIYPITDSKFLTYKAIYENREKLAPFGFSWLNFWAARNEEELRNILAKKLDLFNELIIKPFRGSGGCGIVDIKNKKEISDKIEKSKILYAKKFGSVQTPFPYTITEKVEPLLGNFRGEKRAFDIKIYLARKGNRIFSVGAKFRIAKKDSFISNLTSKGGLAAHRALGINGKNLENLNLDINILANSFAASMCIASKIGTNKKNQ